MISIIKAGMRHLGTACALLTMLGIAPALAADTKPVYIGLDLEYGHATSTSDDAITIGAEIAVEEINRAGGVLGGRPLGILKKDNRSVPARAMANIEDLAKTPDVVAVFCGKFSPVALEALPLVHNLKMPLLDPWGAADGIIDNGFAPSYAFRLSLRDTWAMNHMLREAKTSGLKNFGMLLPNTGWGRSNLKAAENYVRDNPEMRMVSAQWYNWGDTSLMKPYREILRNGAQVLILVANEKEGSLLVKEMAALPKTQQRRVISHWGVTGGNFAVLAGPALEQIDFSVVQTYSFIGAKNKKALTLAAEALRRLNLRNVEQLPSPVGIAHAYDLTHILALAINRAGSTDRAAIRNALEHVQNYDGAIKRYERPFTRERHEALSESDLFLARFKSDGSIHPIAP